MHSFRNNCMKEHIVISNNIMTDDLRIQTTYIECEWEINITDSPIIIPYDFCQDSINKVQLPCLL